MGGAFIILVLLVQFLFLTCNVIVRWFIYCLLICLFICQVCSKNVLKFYF